MRTKLLILIAMLSFSTFATNNENDTTAIKADTTTSRIFESGKASYYGTDYKTGRKTASGQIYNKNKLTAAHKKLPFGTKVKVTNLNNNKSTVVTINDRGPFVKGRVIDLSVAAATEIGMLKSGVSEVILEILD